jgi:hypothetical protein
VYKIETAHYGFRLEFGGIVDEGEMARWVRDFAKALKKQPGEFVVFVDMRTLAPLDKAAQVHIREGQRLAREVGMARSVVILNSPVIIAQFKQIAWETGIYKWERYIDASRDPNWEEAGLDWILRKVDPDKAAVRKHVAKA